MRAGNKRMKTEKHQRRKPNSLNLNPTKSGPRLGLQCCGLLAALALVLGIAPRAFGTITVTTLNDSGPGSLRQAIADAAPGDTIDFAVTGTITLTSGHLAITNNLNIIGPGQTSLTVNGNNSSRAFSVANGTVFISSLTVSNGYATDVTGGGGGVRNYFAGLTISNCCITSCQGQDYGGGINNYGGNLSVLRSKISGNYGYFGGGLLNWQSGQAVVIDSTLSGNSAGNGGGIDNYDATTAITNSTIFGNTASSLGGAIRNSSGGTLTISSSTVSGNKVSGLGSVGGIASVSALCAIFASTVTGNAGVAPEAGGIAVWGTGSMTISGTIVAGNTVMGTSPPDYYGPLISQDYNLIQSTNGATITGVITHNIYGKDPLLGPLADNGGPTWTHALLPGSPAIDHGSSGGLTTDQRGQPRPVRFPAYFAADDGSDIGAYELQERPQTNWVVNGSSSNLLYIVNSKDDVDDGVPGIAHCSLREAINAANANSDSNSIVFAASVPGVMTGVTGTIVLTNGQLSIGGSGPLSITGPGAENLTISGNTSNQVFGIGGGQSACLSGLTVADGKADYGGGVANGGWLTLSRCTLRDNRAAEGGGAVYTTGYWGGSLTVIESVLRNNDGGGIGGAICNDGLAAIIGSSIYSNTASSGGGIWGVFAGSATCLTNCTLSGNTAIAQGGGIGAAIDTTLSFDSCTICSNRAGAGGGILLGGDYDDVYTIRNTLVAGNSAPSGPDISGGRELISGDYNLVQDTNGCTIIGTTAHNIYNQEAKLGPLTDLGGPTPTHALRFDSPAVDTGNSGGLTTDQRGLPRPIGTAKVEGGDGSDIGAYEADPNLRITTLAKAGGDMQMQFNTLLGRNYRVESEDAIKGPWNLLSNNIPGTGGALQAIDTGAATLPRRFYRAVMLLP